MNVKKILIFSLAYYPQVGGAEVAIKEITDRIFDVEFHMVTLRFSSADKAEEKIGNVFVHRVGGDDSYFSKMLFIPRAMLKARQLGRAEKFDGAWAMMSYMTLPLVFLHLPYTLTLQEGDTYGHMFARARILPFLPFINSGFRNAKVVQAISTYLGGWARKRGFKGPLEIIPNGANVQKFSGEKISHEGTVLITSSRLVHKNAVDDIIRALADLPQDVRLVVAGSGPEEKNLKQLAQKLGVVGRVEFLGYVDHARLPALLHAADIFIRPSRSEGMGISFVEAFAAKLPVISTQEGGLKDFISKETAWIVEKDNPRQITLQIKVILGNPEEARRVINNAYNLVVKKYDWSLIARDMREKVFARLF